MKNKMTQDQHDSALLTPEWLGLLGVASSVSPDLSLDDHSIGQIKSALMSRIRASNSTNTEQQHQIILKDAEWRIITPKIHVKVLRNDGVTMSWLLKLLADTKLAAHAHNDCDEECLVMEGAIRLDGKTLTAGDYTVARAGTEHLDIYSEQGCLLFLKSPATHEAGLAALCEA
jgi:hypothetical protein